MDWRWLEERRIIRWCNIRCIKNKTLGSALAWLFALFAVIASFGIGNMTQGNSISGALHATFHIPTWITGIVITVLACNNRDYIICIFYNPTADIASGRAHIVRWTMVLRRPKRSVDLQRHSWILYLRLKSNNLFLIFIFIRCMILVCHNTFVQIWCKNILLQHMDIYTGRLW